MCVCVYIMSVYVNTSMNIHPHIHTNTCRLTCLCVYGRPSFAPQAPPGVLASCLGRVAAQVDPCMCVCVYVCVCVCVRERERKSERVNICLCMCLGERWIPPYTQQALYYSQAHTHTHTHKHTQLPNRIKGYAKICIL
jgi:hypothetical protein